MGLRCSILGHEFADAELEREREERGDEVVVTIREVRTCQRCGAEHVESESTEVRPVEPVDEVADDSSGPDGAGADAGQSSPAGQSTAGAAQGDGDDAASVAPTADPETVEGGADAVDEAEPPSAEEDDGVILDDDGEEAPRDRGEGEWPGADDTRLDERDEPPRDAPEGVDAPPESDEGEGEEEAEESAADEAPDDAEILGDGPDTPEPTSAEGESSAQSDARSVSTGGDWPDHEDTPDEGYAAETAEEGGTDVEFEGLAPGERSASGGSPDPVDPPSLDAEEGAAFVCERCGFTEPVERSSLRAGDICPDCRKGYLREVVSAEE